MYTNVETHIEVYPDDSEKPYKIKGDIGENVKIKIINKEIVDAEDYYYLKKHENKIGTIIERLKSGNGIYSYRIEFAQHDYGYFYYEDFILINEDSD